MLSGTSFFPYKQNPNSLKETFKRGGKFEMFSCQNIWIILHVHDSKFTCWQIIALILIHKYVAELFLRLAHNAAAVWRS